MFEARKSRDIVNKSRASSVTSSSATEQSGVKRKEDARLSIDSPLPEQEGDDSVSNGEFDIPFDPSVAYHQ